PLSNTRKGRVGPAPWLLATLGGFSDALPIAGVAARPRSGPPRRIRGRTPTASVAKSIPAFTEVPPPTQDGPHSMKTSKKGLKKTYSFTLIYTGADDLTQGLCDALFEAGCDDALLGLRDGLITLDFDREAATYQEALQSAIRNVDESGTGL